MRFHIGVPEWAWVGEWMGVGVWTSGNHQTINQPSKPANQNDQEVNPKLWCGTSASYSSLSKHPSICISMDIPGVGWGGVGWVGQMGEGGGRMTVVMHSAL